MLINPDKTCCDIELSFSAMSLQCMWLTHSLVRIGAQPSNHFALTDFDAAPQSRFRGSLANVIQKHLKRKYGLDGD